MRNFSGVSSSFTLRLLRHDCPPKRSCSPALDHPDSMFVSTADVTAERPLLNSDTWTTTCLVSGWTVDRLTSERNGSADLYRVKPDENHSSGSPPPLPMMTKRISHLMGRNWLLPAPVPTAPQICGFAI